MRHQWRLLHLLLRAHNRTPNHTRHLHHLRTLSSLPHRPTPNFTFPVNPSFRHFSSDPVLEQPDPDHALIADLFSKPFADPSVVKSQLELNGVSINHDAIVAQLGKLESNPEVAWRFYHWVLQTHPEMMSSKAYNALLRAFGTNGYVDQFWTTVSSMKSRGYGVSRSVKERVLESFVKRGLEGDVVKLKALFDKSKNNCNTVEKDCARVCRIVRKNVWGDEVEREIKDLNVGFSSEVVKRVLENLGPEPSKALIFFRWVEESGLFKHDGCTYNAMARVLGREDTIDRFWKLVGDMRGAGFEMEIETFVKVVGRFCKRRMIKDAVELYEFAMAGADKPTPQCCTFLLKKVVTSKELDMDLFSRVVKVFSGSGNAIPNSMVDAVLKSMTSVDRVGEWNKVLKEMEDCGYVASANWQGEIAFRIGAFGKTEQANEFVNRIEGSDSDQKRKIWDGLVDGHCVARNLDKALDSFKEMVEKEGISYAETFDLLVCYYCDMNRAIDAYKFLCELVKEKELKPWHFTYKFLVTSLLAQGGFTDALNVLGLMKTHGFPPFTDPFFSHIAKRRSGDDAILFLNAMTSKKFPSTSVYLRMFEAFFKKGRPEEAQNFLSKCPRYIRNHADVLNLFCSMNSKEAAPSGMLAA